MTLQQWFIFFLVIQVIHFLGTWKLYMKAGRKAWEAIVPIYNAIVLMKIINRPLWWVILLFIPVVNLLMFPIIWIETIRSFGKKSRLDSFLVLITLGFYIYYINYFIDVKYIENRSLKPNSALGEWVSSIAFAIIAATLVHTYVMRPYTIPTSSLEKSLLIGDFLFVSKFHYGARVPMTPIALPMVHDSIPFTKLGSYLKKPQLPYFRLPGLQKIKRNEIVVFNWPADTLKTMWGDHSGKYTYKPIDKKTNYVKRCVAIAGDSLQIINGDIYINGKKSILSDRAKLQFYYTYTGKQPFNNQNFPKYISHKERKRHYKIKTSYWNDSRVQKAFSKSAGNAYVTVVNQDSLFVELAGGINQTLINKLSITTIPNKLSVNLTEEEVDKVKKEPNTASVKRLIHSNDSAIFPSNNQYQWSQDNFGPIYIPKKGETVELTHESLPFYKHVIEEYEHNKNVTFNGDEVCIDGKLVKNYTFKQDYYWLMGDNRHNSLDARYWGYVPFDHVVGKPVFIWMSFDGGIGGKPRWERFFTTVHGEGKPVSYFYYFLGVIAAWLVYSNFIKKKKKSKFLLFIPTYFSPIIQYIFIFKNDEIVFEVEDNYQKQTYRNRCNIYGANGKLSLHIPVIHNGKQKTKDIKIDYKSAWHKQHLKSLESAYFSSPFFEFYVDDLRLLYEEKPKFLLDFNIKCHEFIMDALQSEIKYSKTKLYETNPTIKDFRNLAIAKKEPNYLLKPYYQVFNEKHGFISNLSILDLLFMEGPNVMI